MESAEQRQMLRQHIFAVNGSPDFLDVLRELLQGEDYNVTTTNFVPNTFDQIAALDPDLLIIDLVVGHRAGSDLLARLAEGAATSEIPVILVSTSRQLLDEVEMGPLHASEYRYLVKPFDLDDLLRAVKELIGPA
jgi:DNA-binding response OmpR family regulator